jgi:hypothetical protein
MLTENWFHKVYPGFGLWTVANILLGIGFIFIGLRGLIPDLISIIAANAIFVLYCQLVVLGLARFFTLRIVHWWDYISGAIFLVSFSYYTYVAPDIYARTIFISFILTFYLARLAWLTHLGSKAAKFKISGLLFWSFSLLAGWFGLRGILLMIGQMSISITPLTGFYENVTFTFGLCAFILVTAGLIQINSSRVENELLEAQQEIKTLSGILPICSHCKNIRDDKGYWDQVENYISSRTAAKFTHGICPKCAEEFYPGYLEKKEE